MRERGGSQAKRSRKRGMVGAQRVESSSQSERDDELIRSSERNGSRKSGSGGRAKWGLRY